MPGMSEERTQNLTDGRSFEERVFARFDAMEAHFNVRFDSLDVRVQALEEEAKKRALDTKPIWERALAEILELKEKVDDINRKFDVLTKDMMQLRGDHLKLERRMEILESRPQ